MALYTAAVAMQTMLNGNRSDSDVVTTAPVGAANLKNARLCLLPARLEVAG